MVFFLHFAQSDIIKSGFLILLSKEHVVLKSAQKCDVLVSTTCKVLGEYQVTFTL